MLFVRNGKGINYLIAGQSPIVFAYQLSPSTTVYPSIRDRALAERARIAIEADGTAGGPFPGAPGYIKFA